MLLLAIILKSGIRNHRNILFLAIFMYNHISGKLTALSPTHAVIDCGGVGYFIHISLNTFEAVKGRQQLTLYTHLAVKEDSHSLYGFSEEDERSLFRQLITVSGIGTNTARMMLSHLSTNDLFNAIIHGNVPLLQSIKGVGPKSAQRIVLELKDKLKKPEGMASVAMTTRSNTYEEALQALLTLGFSKANIEKALQKVNQQEAPSSVEELIKLSLKIL